MKISRIYGQISSLECSERDAYHKACPYGVRNQHSNGGCINTDCHAWVALESEPGTGYCIRLEAEVELARREAKIPW